MRFQRQTISVEQAVDLLLSNAGVMPAEEVPLAESSGRILAEPVIASCDLPPFDRSPLDGYALRAEDTHLTSPASPVRLTVIETIAAGDIPQHQLKTGEAARIMTGALLPQGADAVVMFEQTEDPGEQRDWVKVKKALQAGDNVSRRGEEVKAGKLIIPAGDQLNAGSLSILATFSVTKPQVRRKPRVGIAATGSELINPEQPIVQGKVRDSNTPMLAALVEEAGGIPIVLPRIDDDVQATRQRLNCYLTEVDLLITTGGVSVGDFDAIASITGDQKFRLLFNRVAMRPGSPTTAICWDDKLLCALSGNPSACYAGFILLVKPLLAKMTGRMRQKHEKVQAILADDYLKPCPYPRYLRGQLHFKGSNLYATPDRIDKSGTITGLHQADCFIVIPAGGRGKQAGETVDIIICG